MKDFLYGSAVMAVSLALAVPIVRLMISLTATLLSR